MARKFNNGRLGEHLMNNEMFLAYNRIKYLGNGFETPIQERQAEIPNYSLWIDRKTNQEIKPKHIFWQPELRKFHLKDFVLQEKKKKHI